MYLILTHELHIYNTPITHVLHIYNTTVTHVLRITVDNSRGKFCQICLSRTVLSLPVLSQTQALEKIALIIVPGWLALEGPGVGLGGYLL